MISADVPHDEPSAPTGVSRVEPPDIAMVAPEDYVAPEPAAATPRAAQTAPAIVVPTTVAATDPVAPAADDRVACSACGQPVARNAYFCSICGHPVGETVTLESTVAAGPGAGPSSRFPFRAVALIVVAMGVVAVGIALVATRIAPNDGAVGGSGDPAVVSTSTGAPHDLTVNVVLDQTLGRGEDPWAKVATGARCAPTGTAFSDIHAGTTVTVADLGGTVLAESTLSDGRKAGPGQCLYRAQVSVPDSRFYRVGIAFRPGTVFSFDELTQAGWKSDFMFVASP